MTKREEKQEKKRKRTVDYKDVERLRKALTEQAKIVGRKRSGASAYAQRQLTRAVKRARFMGLLPFVLH